MGSDLYYYNKDYPINSSCNCSAYASENAKYAEKVKELSDKVAKLNRANKNLQEELTAVKEHNVNLTIKLRKVHDVVRGM